MDSLRHQLFCECEAMASYALSGGMMLSEPICDDLAIIADGRSQCCGSVDVVRLALLHTRLAQLVHPAKPNTLRLLRDEDTRHAYRRILGPLPSVRRLVFAAVFFGVLFICTSTSPYINSMNLQHDIYSSSGIELLAVLGFLLASAGLGASFNVLYTISQSISEGSYDPRSESFSWISIALGLMAGLLLCELVPIKFEPEMDPLVKPMIALLGGFSASLLHRVLGRLVETVGNLFEASSVERLRAQEQELRLRAADQARTERAQITGALVDALGRLRDGAGPDQAQNAILTVIDRLDGRRPAAKPARPRAHGSAIEDAPTDATLSVPREQEVAPVTGEGQAADWSTAERVAAIDRGTVITPPRWHAGASVATERSAAVEPTPRRPEGDALLQRLGLVAPASGGLDRGADGGARARDTVAPDPVLVPSLGGVEAANRRERPAPESRPVPPPEAGSPQTVSAPVEGVVVDPEVLAVERLGLLDILGEFDPDSTSAARRAQRGDIEAALALVRQRRADSLDDRDAVQRLHAVLAVADPAAELVATAGDAFAAVLRTPTPPLHLVDALALAAARLGDQAFDRLLARVQTAPFSAELIAMADLNDEEVHSAVSGTTVFASAYAAEIEVRDLDFLNYLAREAVDGDVEAFWHAESRRFDDREGFIDGVTEFQAALLDQLVRAELPPEAAARAGGATVLLASLDALHADPQARIELDRITTLIAELRGQGFDVEELLGTSNHG